MLTFYEIMMMRMYKVENKVKAQRNIHKSKY